jgi:hypothetical protein
VKQTRSANMSKFRGFPVFTTVFLRTPLPGIGYFVAGQAVPDISKDRVSCLQVSPRISKFLKIKKLRSSETSVTSYPATQRCIPE